MTVMVGGREVPEDHLAVALRYTAHVVKQRATDDEILRAFRAYLADLMGVPA